MAAATIQAAAGQDSMESVLQKTLSLVENGKGGDQQADALAASLTPEQLEQLQN